MAKRKTKAKAKGHKRAKRKAAPAAVFAVMAAANLPPDPVHPPSLGRTSVAAEQDGIVRNALLLQDLNAAEYRASKAEKELGEFRRKLVALLSPDQLDAAKTCGVTPEFYALECIELYKAKFFSYLPVELRPLAALKTGGGF